MLQGTHAKDLYMGVVRIDEFSGVLGSDFRMTSRGHCDIRCQCRDQPT